MRSERKKTLSFVGGICLQVRNRRAAKRSWRGLNFPANMVIMFRQILILMSWLNSEQLLYPTYGRQWKKKRKKKMKDSCLPTLKWYLFY